MRLHDAPPRMCQVYGVIGVFGAARYGLATQGNVLVNTWLGGRWEGILDLAVAAYLSISVPPMQVARAAYTPAVGGVWCECEAAVEGRWCECPVTMH